MKKRFSVLYLLIFISIISSSYSQNSVDDTTIALVEKNMTFYKLAHIQGYNYCFEKGHIKPNIERYILGRNEHFDLKISQIDSIKFPSKDLELYLIKNNFYCKKIDGEQKINLVTFTHGVPYDKLIENKILIGYNSNTKDVLFISGPVVKNCIADYFNLDLNNLEGFNQFLSLKLFIMILFNVNL